VQELSNCSLDSLQPRPYRSGNLRIGRPHRSTSLDPVLNHCNPTRNSKQLHVVCGVLVEDLGVDGRIILKMDLKELGCGGHGMD